MGAWGLGRRADAAASGGIAVYTDRGSPVGPEVGTVLSEAGDESRDRG
jgi:hypothetical protein